MLALLTRDQRLKFGALIFRQALRCEGDDRLAADAAREVVDGLVADRILAADGLRVRLPDG